MASFEVHEEATAAAAWRPVDVPRQTSRSGETDQRMPPPRSPGSSRGVRPHLNRVLSQRLIELDGVQAAADAPVMVIAASARADCIGPDDVPRQTSRSVRTDSGTQSAQNRVTFIIPAPPSRNCYGKLCSPWDWPPDPRDVADVFRRRTRTPESPPSADWNEWQGPPGLFTSVPRITDEETHRRLMSEVEAGTANSGARALLRRDGEEKRGARPAHGGHLPLASSLPGQPVDHLTNVLPVGRTLVKTLVNLPPIVCSGGGQQLPMTE